MKVLVFNTRSGRYRISVYPGSLGCFLEYQNKQKRKINKDFYILKFVSDEGNKEIYLDDDFKDRKRLGILKGFVFYSYQWIRNNKRYFQDHVIMEVPDYVIRSIYWDQASDREIRLMTLARILK